MNEQTWTHIDKTAWGDGPWHTEPDKIQWIDEQTDLDCLIVRGERHGALCGYVGVPPGHPWHGLHYGHGRSDDVVDTPESTIDVHGGLTFANKCMEDAPEGHGVCHIPAPGRPADVWWFGFDCGHFMDIAPGYDVGVMDGTHGEVYRAVPYVRSEVEQLARQLAAVA